MPSNLSGASAFMNRTHDNGKRSGGCPSGDFVSIGIASFLPTTEV